MITCVAIDDEPLALEVIRNYLEGMPGIRLVQAFTDALQALAFLKTTRVDFLVLDIQMPDINGIRLLQSLKEPPLVIMTTAFAEYAVKGYELEVVDYLLKPVRPERFVKAVDKVQRLLGLREAAGTATDEEHMFVKSGYGIQRVNFGEIRYIEGLDDYIRIHFTTERPPVLSLMSLKAVFEMLPSGRFLRVHRSFIVALKQIRFVRKKTIVLAP